VAELTTPPEIAAGELIAEKYRVERVLGQGGMGVVVAAHHEQLDQRVALKFLLPAVLGNDEIVKRFLREARSAVKIHSEHVARVFDVGKHRELPFMVMEYLEGADIAQTIVERGPLPAREAVGYLLEACDAVAEAHALGIVHRDLKPANLFLAKRPSGKPTVKVLDFGISKAPVTERDRNITNATAIMGSPSYMSPEQLVASASVDVRSDIWSLGVVLYEMVTGALPFNATSMPELVGVILQIAPTLDAVPPELRPIIERCLQKQREQRFDNVADLARALAPLVSPRYEPLVERIEGVLGSAPPPSSTPTAASVPQAQSAIDNRTLGPTTTSVPKNRQPIWVAVLAVVVVAGVVVAALKFARRDPVAASIAVTAAPVQSTLPVIASSVPVTTAEMPSATTFASVTTPAHTNVHAHAALSATIASASAVVSPIAPPAPSESGCKTVSYFDQAGNKHFRLECH
jgi:serine/threonine protein kinase